MPTPDDAPQHVHVADDDQTGGEAPDSQSDPSLDDGESSDWSSEGGAVPEGPATDADNSDETDDDR